MTKKFLVPVELPAAPTLDLQASTKKYVDDTAAIISNYLKANYTQMGTVNIAMVAADTVYTSVITFPKAYTSTPRVVCQVRSAGINSGWATASITTSQFTITVVRMVDYTGGTAGATSRDVDWVAVGPVASL